MKIKSFEELFKNINESLESPIEVNWIKTNTHWVGSFNTDKNNYRIVISNEMNDIWKFKYFLKSNSGLSVKMTELNYDVWKVLSTIYKSVYDFIDEVNPNGIIFGADNDSSTRVKFYSTFSDKCSKKYNYKKYEKSFGEEEVNPTIYVLYRELTPDELYKIIEKVTNDELGLNN